MPRQKPTRIQYLIEAIKIETDECIEWPYCRNPKGYGKARWNGKEEFAHRVVLRIVNPNGFDENLKTLHSCDNPPCFNKRHLSQGTNADNTRDMMLKGRLNAPKGEKQRSAKLKSVQIIEIRNRYQSGEKRKDLAEVFQVSASCIGDIVHGVTWKHIN